MLVLLLLWPLSARAGVGIATEAQIAATRVGTTDYNWRIWAVREDAHLVTVHRNGSPWIWTDRLDCGSPPLTTRGAAATWWNDGLHQYERAVYLGVDGNTYEYGLTDGGSPTCTKLDFYKPASSFTGYVTVLNGVSGGTRYRTVWATTADGSLWADIQDVSSGMEYGWFPFYSGFATNRPLASTVNAAGTVWSVFAVRSGDGLTLVRLDPVNGWSRTNIAGPGVPVCGSLAVAQGQLSGEYWVAAFCTSTNYSDTVMRIAHAPSETSTSFSWDTVTVPGGASLDNLGFTVAAIDRPAGGGYVALDAYGLGTNDHVYRFTKVGGSPVSAVDRGQTGEGNSSTDGGMAAMRNGPSNHSRAAFTGALTGATYLYARAGSDTATWPWEALGGGEPVQDISGVDPGDRTRTHTEAMIAEWNGKVAAVSIVRGGPTPQDTDVDWAWSNNDGYDWSYQQEFEKPSGIDYLTDPLTVFTTSGKAYAVMLGLDYSGTTCSDGDLTLSRVFYRTTTTGTSWSTPVDIPYATGSRNLDHPWVGIDRSVSPNLLHFVWWNADYPSVHYRKLTDGVGFDQDDVIAGSSFPDCAGIPALTVGSDGTVFVSWRGSCSGDHSVRVCPVSWNEATEHYECAPKLVLSGSLDLDSSNIPVPGTSYYIQQLTGWSIQASRTMAGRLYYAYQRRETDDPAPPSPNEKDVYVAVLTYSGGSWTPGAPVPVTVVNDDRDQFSPSVNVDFGGGGYQSIVVSWYDRREDCDGHQNYCIRRKRAYSSTGLSFLYVQDSQRGVPLTDPTRLPHHCKDFTNRLFIGDFQEGQPGVLHSHHIWSWAPAGWSPPGVALSEGFLSAGGFYY